MINQNSSTTLAKSESNNDMSSLNITIRKKQIQQLNDENMKMYKRLTEVKPVISTEKLVKQSNKHLFDIASRLKRYRNHKIDPLVIIAKKREREYLTGGLGSQSQASLNASPHFDIEQSDSRLERY